MQAIQEEPPCERQRLERDLLLPVKRRAPLWTILMHEWDVGVGLEDWGAKREGCRERDRTWEGDYCVTLLCISAKSQDVCKWKATAVNSLGGSTGSLQSLKKKTTAEFKKKKKTHGTSYTLQTGVSSVRLNKEEKRLQRLRGKQRREKDWKPHFHPPMSLSFSL